MNDNSLDENPHKIKSLKFNTIINAFRMTLTVLVPLITFPYTSRIFLADGSGKINFVSSVVQMFTTVASLGCYSYGLREGSKRRNDINVFSKFGQELIFINLVSTIITYIIFFACIFFIPKFYDCRWLLIINGATIGFTSLGMDWVFGVYEDYTYITLRQIIGQLFNIITLFLFIHDQKDIYLYVFLTSFSCVTVNIMSIVYAHKYISYRPNKRYNYEIKKHLTPIFILFATSLAAKVYSNIDVILLGFMTADHNVGIYSAAVKINTLMITFLGSMPGVFVPRIVEYIDNNNYNEFYALLKKIISVLIGFGIPMVVGIELLSDKAIIIIAGDDFAQAIKTMRILAPIILVNVFSIILYYNVLVPLKKEKNVLCCTLVGAIINTIISLFLIPILKENGAAIGSLVSELIAFITACFFCIKENRGILKAIPYIHNYIIGVVVIIFWCIACQYLINSFWLQIFAEIFGSAFLYLVTLIVLKDFIGTEIIKLLKKKVKF